MLTGNPVQLVRRRAAFLSAAFAVLLGLFVNGAAVAGGWAVSTLDPISQRPSVAHDVAIGVTIRQHGATPVALDDVAIVIVNKEGTRLSFSAAPKGPVGHYVAAVRFPEAGDWTWEVEQGWFGVQQLGSITVDDAQLSTPADSVRSTRNRWSLPVRLALSTATFITGVSTTALWLRLRRNGSVPLASTVS